MDIVINRLDGLPPDIGFELLQASIRENFSPIQWLIDQWKDGQNQFSLPGEALYEARDGDRLIGVCGINQDPYVDSKLRLGRIRRLYVLPEYRRQGVGRKLVLRATVDAHSHFSEINLRTFDTQSAKFFEAIGFVMVEGNAQKTHQMFIGK
jgi:N-acetylglutamate synthase-like GNAT family acetyltransferase